MNPSILTQSGLYIDLTNPDPELIQIEDIAHALARICRFTGHTERFYSVAEHCVHTSYLVPPIHALTALLHDAAETYIGDVASPLKQLLPDYKAIEQRMEAAVFAAFGLAHEVTYPLPDCVKHADMVMLATERRDLMPDQTTVWPQLAGIEPLPFRIDPMPPAEAAQTFHARFVELTSNH